MFCNNCGKEIDDKAVVCVHCGVPTKSTNAPAQEDGSLGCLLGGVCFLVPIVGLILYLMWKDTTPMKAKEAGKWALIGFVVGFVMSIIYYFVVVAAVASTFSYY